MRLTLPGTGDARQVPVYNCSCPACDSARVYPARRRGPCSALIECGTQRWLIDSGLTRGQLANSITIAYPERFTIEQMREKSAKQSAFIADAMQRALAAIDRKEGAA